MITNYNREGEAETLTISSTLVLASLGAIRNTAFEHTSGLSNIKFKLDMGGACSNCNTCKKEPETTLEIDLVSRC